jgi:hypothetical protein
MDDMHIDGNVTFGNYSSKTLDLNGHTMNVGGDWTMSANAAFDPDSGKVIFDGAGSHTITSDDQSFYALEFNNASGVWELQDGLICTSLTVYAGIFDINNQSFNFAASTAASVANGAYIRLHGNETIGANVQNFDIDSGTVEYVGDNTGSTYPIKDFGTTDYFNLTINDINASEDTFNIASGLTIAGAFTLTDGTVTQNVAIAITGAYTQSGGTFTSTDPASDSFSVTGDFSIPDTAGTFRRFSGTDPDYTIYDVYGLQSIKCWLGKNFTLAQDISAADTANWTYGFDPIGTSTARFTGSFNGANHTIADLTINTTGNYIGLFG